MWFDYEKKRNVQSIIDSGTKNTIISSSHNDIGKVSIGDKCIAWGHLDLTSRGDIYFKVKEIVPWTKLKSTFPRSNQIRNNRFKDNIRRRAKRNNGSFWFAVLLLIILLPWYFWVAVKIAFVLLLIVLGHYHPLFFTFSLSLGIFLFIFFKKNRR